jgi:hypothetical protein
MARLVRCSPGRIEECTCAPASEPNASSRPGVRWTPSPNSALPARFSCARANEQTNKQNPRNKQTNPRNGRLSGTGGTAHFSPVKLLQTNRRAARHHAERTLPCMPFYEVAGRCSFACALGSKLATAIVRAARGRARRQWAGPRCAFRGCATGAPRRIIATSIAPIT